MLKDGLIIGGRPSQDTKGKKGSRKVLKGGGKSCKWRLYIFGGAKNIACTLWHEQGITTMTREISNQSQL